jgi:hypothetical protein
VRQRRGSFFLETSRRGSGRFSAAMDISDSTTLKKKGHYFFFVVSCHLIGTT